VSDDDKLDVVVGVGQTADGEGVKVVRLRDALPDEESGRVIEVGEVRRSIPDTALPANAEVVRLSAREGTNAFDVEVVVPRRALSGPAQYATAAYRANWTATFGDDDDVN
jgi:hypothetical protein